jgi:hypothetical protein
MLGARWSVSQRSKKLLGALVSGKAALVSIAIAALTSSLFVEPVVAGWLPVTESRPARLRAVRRINERLTRRHGFLGRSIGIEADLQHRVDVLAPERARLRRMFFHQLRLLTRVGIDASRVKIPCRW